MTASSRAAELAPSVHPPALGTRRRWLVFVTGLGCLVTGISLSITADLGVGSWQVLETGLVNVSGASFGVVAATESLVALSLAWVWLGERPWFATAVLVFAGVPIGILLDLLSTPGSLAGQAVMFTVGMVLIAVGVAFYLAADLGASAQDAMFVGVYKKYGVRPGVVRFGLDASLVLLGAALGGQFGVGTLVVTVTIPLMIEPALRLGHRLAATPIPVALRRDG